jgi:hypothetical protein
MVSLALRALLRPAHRTMDAAIRASRPVGHLGHSSENDKKPDASPSQASRRAFPRVVASGRLSPPVQLSRSSYQISCRASLGTARHLHRSFPLPDKRFPAWAEHRQIAVAVHRHDPGRADRIDLTVIRDQHAPTALPAASHDRAAHSGPRRHIVCSKRRRVQVVAGQVRDGSSARMRSTNRPRASRMIGITTIPVASGRPGNTARRCHRGDNARHGGHSASSTSLRHLRRTPDHHPATSRRSRDTDSMSDH